MAALGEGAVFNERGTLVLLFNTSRADAVNSETNLARDTRGCNPVYTCFGHPTRVCIPRPCRMTGVT